MADEQEREQEDGNTKHDLDVVQTDVVADRLGKQRNKGILLQLERPNGIRASATAQLLAISQGNNQSSPSSCTRQQVADLHASPRPNGEAGVCVAKGNQKRYLAPCHLVAMCHTLSKSMLQLWQARGN